MAGTEAAKSQAGVPFDLGLVFYIHKRHACNTKALFAAALTADCVQEKQYVLK
jgi:hypothetical protein